MSISAINIRKVRLLIVPGLHDSGPAHWQSWLQAQYRDSLRVRQRDFGDPQLDRWAARIGAVLDHAGGGQRWIAVAHSFGCLALARHLALAPESPIAAALFVAPAEPDKFGVGTLLPQRPLSVPSTLVASDSDPWMHAASTRLWAGLCQCARSSRVGRASSFVRICGRKCGTAG